MTATTTPTYSSAGYLGSDPGVARLLDNVQSMVPAVVLSFVNMQVWNTIEDFYIRSTRERRIMSWQMAVGVQTIDFNPFDETWLVAWVLGFSGLHKGLVIPPGVLRDLQNPASPRCGEVLLALKPVNYNVVYPVDLFSTWFEVLLDGVLWRLYRVPAKPYSSPQLAEYHGKMYRAGVARARAVADAENTNGPGRWRFPYFANGRRKN